jgi:2'-5' RNA ligase
VREAADKHPAFEIRLGAPRVLPTGSRPRLVCADLLMGEVQIHRLTADVRARLQLACPDVSLSRSRTPHITLARFRRQATRADSEGVSRSLTPREGSSPSRSAWIADVQVVASALTPRGPVYEIKRQVPLTTLDPRPLV